MHSGQQIQHVSSSHVLQSSFFQGTYTYMWNQTHIWDNRNDDTEAKSCQERYLYLQPQKLCLMCILRCNRNIGYGAMCRYHTVSFVLPYSDCLAGAYLRKVPAAQRKACLHRQERVPGLPPSPAALSSSEECSGSRWPCVAGAELGSGPGAPASESQTCGRGDATSSGPHTASSL